MMDRIVAAARSEDFAVRRIGQAEHAVAVAKTDRADAAQSVFGEQLFGLDVALALPLPWDCALALTLSLWGRRQRATCNSTQ